MRNNNRDKRPVDNRLEEIVVMLNFHDLKDADKAIDDIYEDYTRNRIHMNAYQVSLMFELIDRISTAIYG